MNKDVETKTKNIKPTVCDKKSSKQMMAEISSFVKLKKYELKTLHTLINNKAKELKMSINSCIKEFYQKFKKVKKVTKEQVLSGILLPTTA